MLVLDREPAHRHEPGEDQRMEARLRAEREEDVAVEAPQLPRVVEPGRVEAFDLAGDADERVARVERADPVDAAPPRDRGVPGRPGVVAERRDGAEAGDDYTFLHSLNA